MEINDKKVVTVKAILPGTSSGGKNTEALEAMLSIMLGMKLCII